MSGNSGDRRPTMADVAAAAEVSTALVSIVMRDVPGASAETRARILKVADQLGYVPDRRAQKLRRSRSGQVGVTFELQQPFHGDLVESLYPAAAGRGFELVLSCITPTRDEAEAAAALLRERCEAAVLLGSRMTAAELDALAARMPTQVVARIPPTERIGAVRTDDTAGVGAAVEHLLHLGHRRIVYVDGGDAPGSAERAAGFRDHMRTHGLSRQARVLPGGPTETDGVNSVANLLLERRTFPTAIMAFNDRSAVGVVDALLRQGISIPDQMSVIGYDDSRLSRMSHIQLSTVAQDVRRMAELIIEQAVGQIDGGRSRDIVLQPTLVPRATTGPAPH